MNENTSLAELRKDVINPLVKDFFQNTKENGPLIDNRLYANDNSDEVYFDGFVSNYTSAYSNNDKNSLFCMKDKSITDNEVLNKRHCLILTFENRFKFAIRVAMSNAFRYCNQISRGFSSKYESELIENVIKYLSDNFQLHNLFTVISVTQTEIFYMAQAAESYIYNDLYSPTFASIYGDNAIIVLANALSTCIVIALTGLKDEACTMYINAGLPDHEFAEFKQS